MKYDFDQYYPRGNTGSIKWDFLFENGEYRQRPVGDDPLAPGELLPMGLADMDFATSRPIIDALVERMQHGILGYTLPTDAYYEAITGWMERRHHWSLPRDWIVTTPGVMQSINLLVQSFTQPGDGVIIQPPVFMPIADAVENNGRWLIRNPLLFRNGRYSMDFEDLAVKAAAPRAKMMILCSPHNPVGRMWDGVELRRIGEICREHDLLLISDEIHGELVYSWASFTPVGAIDQKFHDRLLLCHSASKSFNLPGLRTSLTIIPNEILRQQFRITLRNNNEHFGVNTLGTLALQTAFEQGEEWLGQLMSYVEANYRFLEKYVERHLPRIQIVHPEALYLIWLDCRQLGLSSTALKQRLLDEAMVYLESGSSFGVEGEGFLRMNIACPRAILAAALERIRQTVASL